MRFPLTDGRARCIYRPLTYAGRAADTNKMPSNLTSAIVSREHQITCPTTATGTFVGTAADHALQKDTHHTRTRQHECGTVMAQ